VGRNQAVRHDGVNAYAVAAGACIATGGPGGLSTAPLVFYTSPVPPSSFGNAYGLRVIAAAVLGGCPLRGGEGSVPGVVPGIVLGTVPLILQNLVSILGNPSSHDSAVTGTVIPPGILAGQGLAARRKAQAPGRALGAAAP